MKKIVIKISIIFLSILIIDRIVAFKLTKMYEDNYCKHSGGDLNYYLKFQDADTVFLGSSRVSTMIAADSIGKSVLNLASSGKHFYYNASVIHLMEKYNKLPKKVLILNLEAEDFYIENKASLIDNVFYLKYYYDKERFIKNSIDSKSSYEKYKFMLSSYKFNGENFLIVTNQFQNICDNEHENYTPLNPTMYDSLKVMSGMRVQEKVKLTVLNSECLNVLKKISLLCKKHNVKLVIVYGPHYYYPKKYQYASLFVKYFCKKNDISYLDFNTKNITQFKGLDSWYDIVHLNKKASMIYTKLIKGELRKLNLIKKGV